MIIYALIIGTIYPKSIIEHKELNEAVIIDAKTIKSVFKDFSELLIPAGVLSKKLIKDVLVKINAMVDSLVQRKIKEVNVVLNTHGSPGKLDIDTVIIIELIKYLSLKNIKINALSALLCDGFTINQSQRENLLYDNAFWSKKKHDQRSSMVILQERLNNLETKIAQSYIIRGFKGEYDSEKDKAAVINLLLGESDDYLFVETKEEKKDDINEIRNAIKTCRVGYKFNPKEYERASQILRVILKKINDNIEQYLCNTGVLKSESLSLYKAVIKYGGLLEKPSSNDFKNYYKDWIKEFKLFSEQRLATLSHYCEVVDSKNFIPKPPDICSLSTSTDDCEDADSLNLSNGLYAQFFGNYRHVFQDLTPIDPYNAYAITPWSNNYPSTKPLLLRAIK